MQPGFAARHLSRFSSGARAVYQARWLTPQRALWCRWLSARVGEPCLHVELGAFCASHPVSHEYPCTSGGHVLVLVLTMGMSKLHDASAGQCWEACVCTPESGRLGRSRGDLHAGPHCVQTFAAKALPVCLWSFPCFRGRVLSGCGVTALQSSCSGT